MTGGESLRFEAAAPAELGVDSRGVLRFLDAAESRGIDLHSLLILRHGRLAAEGYWKPYGPDKTYTLFSASKSFTALGVGFAVQDGLLHTSDRVVSWFPEYAGAPVCANMKKVTVRHLLTMTVGFEEDPHDFPFEGRTDWIRNFLTADVPLAPGSRFVYSTHASYMLSALVQRAAGKTLWEYLREKLFGPLGITGEWWEKSPQGVSVGGWGLMLTTGDFAKLGQFLLDGGRWQGRQLLDEAWVREAVSFQVSNRENPAPNPLDAPDFHAGYGYQFWRLRAGNAYMASGGFGQYVLVFPEKDAVVAMTCGTHADGLFHSIWKELYPAFAEDAGRLDGACDRALLQRLAALSLPLPGGAPHGTSAERRFDGAACALRPNRRGFTRVSFDFSGEEPAVTFTLPEGDFTVAPGYGCWRDGKTCIRPEDTDTDLNAVYPDVSCAFGWEGDELVLRMVYDHTPFWDTLRFSFEEETLLIRAARNVWHYGETIDTALFGLRCEGPNAG